MADINCNVTDCVNYSCGECIAEHVEIECTLTAAGFLNICKSYEEE